MNPETILIVILKIMYLGHRLRWRFGLSVNLIKLGGVRSFLRESTTNEVTVR
jgi:hypothetical protein